MNRFDFIGSRLEARGASGVRHQGGAPGLVGTLLGDARLFERGCSSRCGGPATAVLLGLRRLVRVSGFLRRSLARSRRHRRTYSALPPARIIQLVDLLLQLCLLAKQVLVDGGQALLLHGDVGNMNIDLDRLERLVQHLIFVFALLHF